MITCATIVALEQVCYANVTRPLSPPPHPNKEVKGRLRETSTLGERRCPWCALFRMDCSVIVSVPPKLVSLFMQVFLTCSVLRHEKNFTLKIQVCYHIISIKGTLLYMSLFLSLAPSNGIVCVPELVLESVAD